MRKLIILRGASGCGKSTFIKNNDLENYTLSTDTIRLMFSSPELGIDYKESIPQFNNKKVWELLYTLLEERMKKGEFTIVDAVHAYADESFSIYKKLAEKYRYRLYVLDFTDIPKEEVYERNKGREIYRQVPESSIDRVFKAFEKERISTAFKVIKPENFNEIINTTPRDLNGYEKVHIIGDIHGSATALKTYFIKYPISEKDYYIFCGDYFDRGIENYQTFKFLSKLMLNKNMTFLIGNHEDKLYKYACDDEFKMDYDIKNTIEEFEMNHLKKSEIRRFIKNLSQLALITFKDKTYLITHGGLPYIPNKSLDFYSTNSFVYGIDKYETDIDKIYNEFMQTANNKIYQVHGHRNFYKNKFDKYEYSINLEGDIEHGGNLRILTLTNNNYKYTEIKNTVYNPNLIEETNIYNLVENLRNNKYVFEKDLGNNISSFNFTKEAFYNKMWDKETTKARGLFIDTKNYKIVARSYNKFFKVDERKETTLDSLKENLIFPVNFYLKYNGFLGILSVYNDELFFASKSTNAGDYVEYFKNIFYKKYSNKQIEVLKDKLTKENLSAVFEVIDPFNDPHIIEYQEENLVLLDLIKNTTNFEKISYPDLQIFAQNNNISVKELAYAASNIDEFMSIYDKITAPNYKYKDSYIEGFVIEDANAFMVKTKTVYYDKWKYLRNKMENALKNNKFNTKSNDELEISFLSYLKEKYQGKKIGLESINIIQERHNFYG
ncbi:MAG TPA: metallophosphoesterase [Candidatus Onthocola stercoravium]|nr:metallophosphoesterase [Candidatus Onthocola stercoravium]